MLAADIARTVPAPAEVDEDAMWTMLDNLHGSD